MTRILTILGAVMLILQLLGAFRYLANEWKLWRRGHGPMMRTLIVLCALASSVVPVSAYTTDSQEDICATAAVIYCDNFEDRGLGKTDLSRAKYKNPGWSASAFTQMGVVTDDKFDGSKSFRFTYPTNESSGFLDTALGDTQGDLYFRLYTRWSSNWVLSSVAEKMLEPEGGWAVYMFHSVFAGNLSTVSNHSGGTYVKWSPNVGSGDAFLRGSGQTEWNCLEGHVRLNSTTNSTDGVIEAWYNDVQRISFSSINVSTQRTTMNDMILSAYWNHVVDGTNPVDYNDVRNQHPEMYRWHDNIVVSTARIGCLGNPGGGASSNMYIMILKSLDGIGQWIGLGLSAGGLLMRQSVRAWMWRGALASMAALLCLGVGVKTRILLSSAYVRHHTITVAEKYLEHVTTKKG